MTPRDLAMLMLLGAIWGSSFMFISLSVNAFGPAALVVFRVLAAGAVLMAYARMRGLRLALRPHWQQFLLLGSLNAAVPFVLIAYAQLTLPASFASIMNSITPMFAAVLSVFLLGEALTTRRMIGLVLGVIGVGLVVGWSPFDLTAQVVVSIGAMMAAALCYALGTIYVRRAFSGVPTMTMAVGQQLGAGAVLLPLAAFNPPTNMTLEALLAASALALLGTAFAYQLYFTLVQRVGPTNTATVTLIVPMFGVLWGVLLLRDPITWGTLIGFGVILGSLMLITGFDLRVLWRTAPTTQAPLAPTAQERL
jgi:drug/metabolite transporter (DMT)-like permease